jgi:peptide/nickel transport system substrate-binding protein
MNSRKFSSAALAIGLAASMALSACSTDDDDDAAGDGTIIIGTTDKIITIDPAGAYDNGSYTAMINVYSFLYGFTANNSVPQPDAAELCEFTAADTVICTLRAGLKFANGHDLTASDVVFSYQRIVNINDDSGPASLLENMISVEAVDDLTVKFVIASENDQTWLQILASPAGPIVDEEVFDPNALTDESKIVSENAFAGPYTITNFKKNDTVTYGVNANYVGVQPTPQNTGITVKTYTDGSNLRLDIASGAIDVAYRSLTPTDIATLRSDSKVKVIEGPGGELRYIVFNLKVMPGANDAQKLAIRQAFASLVDRQALADNVFQGIYSPACSFVPEGLLGANEAICDKYGSTPNQEQAKNYLLAAGYTEADFPIAVPLEYNPDHYGSSSAEEYTAVKQQLEAGGLFAVTLDSAEWTTYTQERRIDSYPIFQLGWFPDYPDADNYLGPFFNNNSFLKQHFNDPDYGNADATLSAMLVAEVTEGNEAARAQKIGDLQIYLAEQLPTLPLLVGKQIAVTGADVTGVVLDASFQFRYSGIHK